MPKTLVSLVSLVSFYVVVSFVSFCGALGSSMYPFLSSKRVYGAQKDTKDTRDIWVLGVLTEST
jgi:hypothetical protein